MSSSRIHNCWASPRHGLDQFVNRWHFYGHAPTSSGVPCQKYILHWDGRAPTSPGVPCQKYILHWDGRAPTSPGVPCQKYILHCLFWPGGIASPGWNVSVVNIRLWKRLWMYCPGHAREKGNDQSDKLAGKATLTSGFLFGTYKMLRSLRHYLWVQSQRHHTIDCLEERGVKRGSPRRSSVKGRERAIISQMKTGTVSKATLGKLPRDTVERTWAFLSA